MSRTMFKMTPTVVEHASPAKSALAETGKVKSAGSPRRLLAALHRIGWVVAWQRGSHRRLARPGWANYTFAFHDGEEVGPALLTLIAKKTGLKPEDL